MPLAVTSAQRSPLLPEVPTMVELGYKDFTMTTWYAIWGRQGHATADPGQDARRIIRC